MALETGRLRCCKMETSTSSPVLNKIDVDFWDNSFNVQNLDFRASLGVAGEPLVSRTPGSANNGDSGKCYQNFPLLLEKRSRVCTFEPKMMENQCQRIPLVGTYLLKLR